MQLNRRSDYEKYFKSKIKEGFTLAEVLLTLTIIGIIASLTIPDVLADIQTTKYRSAWKAEFSVLARATEQLISDKGSNKNLGTSGDNDTYRALYGNYLIYLKTCASGAVYSNGCWDPAYKMMNNDAGYWNLANFSGAVLANGSSIVFVYVNKDCANGPIGSIYRCAALYIDVDGPSKGPNKLGYDIYFVNTLENNLSPYGSKDGNENTCKTSSTGMGCAADYLLN